MTRSRRPLRRYSDAVILIAAVALGLAVITSPAWDKPSVFGLYSEASK